MVDQLWRLEFAGARIQVVISDFETSGELAFVATRITMNPTDYGGPQQNTSGSAMFILRSDFLWEMAHSITGGRADPA